VTKAAERVKACRKGRQQGRRGRLGRRNPLAAPGRLTLRTSAMINTRHGIPVFTGNDRSSRHRKHCATCGRVSRAAKGADCKSAGLRLRRFESYLSHQTITIFNIFNSLNIAHVSHRVGGTMFMDRSKPKKYPSVRDREIVVCSDRRSQTSDSVKLNRHCDSECSKMSDRPEVILCDWLCRLNMATGCN
jgi:hypothetical protein